MKTPAEMSAGEINRELDRLDAKDSQLTREFIDAGRGHERPSEMMKQSDSLSRRYQELQNRRFELRYEIDRRYGPGAPSRLPKGFGRIKNPGPKHHTTKFDRCVRSVKKRLAGVRDPYAVCMAALGKKALRKR